MKNTNKELKVSDKDIEQGIRNGRFEESGTQIRDTSNGQIVKVIKRKEASTNYIPETLIQIHHSYTYCDGSHAPAWEPSHNYALK